MAAHLTADAVERTQLIRARQALGLNRRQLADKIGLTRQYLYCIERGLRDPTLAIMQRWVEALGPYGTFELFRQPYEPRVPEKGNARLAADDAA
jgi:transcriptional regulator with XRE-family HTH domain